MKTTNTTLTFGLVIVCAALLGGWMVTRSDAASGTTGSTQAPDDELQRLLTARLDSATKALRVERAKLDNGKTTFETVYQAAQRMLDAELALSTTADQRVSAVTKHVALMRQFEQDAVKRIEYGALAPGEDETARCLRLTAEVELLRVKRAGATAK
jgi:hypothetical protein